MSFELIPAIDLLGGECVRLTQGRYEDKTVYEADPGVAAARFVAHAIRRLHTVDLDGAKAGRPVNTDAIAKIVKAAGSVPVQLGGGIRNLEGIEQALALGVERVILGTVALREPQLVAAAAKRFPGHIAVGIDARDGMVAVEGWLETSDVSAIEVARRFEDAGVSAIIHTDIGRDGMMEGPNLESTVELARAISIPVIVSGGVRSADDIEACAKRTADGIAGAIVGRALYVGGVSVEEALERIAACS
jgi:phosphoribosylformimino-5-aminoimidazole carboxamide ribotide isomerase